MMGADFDFRFRCRVAPDSEYFGILSYYKKLKRERGGRAGVRRLILENAFNYWQPFVSLPENRGKAVDSAVICIYRLERKIEELKAELALGGGEKSLNELPRASEIVFNLVSRITKNNPAEIELARYLKEKENFSPFEKILWSSDALSGVTAYRELKIYDGKQIREKTEKCISGLKQHVRFLYRFFPEISEHSESKVEIERDKIDGSVIESLEISGNPDSDSEDDIEIAELLL